MSHQVPQRNCLVTSEKCRAYLRSLHTSEKHHASLIACCLSVFAYQQHCDSKASSQGGTEPDLALILSAHGKAMTTYSRRKLLQMGAQPILRYNGTVLRPEYSLDMCRTCPGASTRCPPFGGLCLCCLIQADSSSRGLHSRC